MAEDSFQEKTEKATPKKRSDARKKGRVAISKEVSSVFVLLISLGVFFFAGSYMCRQITMFMHEIFFNLGSIDLHESSINAFTLLVFKQIISVLFPLLLAVFVAGIAGNIVQFGFLFTHEPLVPKFARLDPVKGMEKLFSLRSFIELVKMLLKIMVVGGVAYILLKGEVNTIPSLMQMGIGDILSYIGRSSFKICFYTCLVLIVLASLDYAFQKWQHEKDLRMTKQEVKEETKQREGDPSVKSRIKRAQIEMAQRRMMEDVPKADVVITNPTKLAIALKFDATEMIAPKVVAKGAGFIAQRIKDIAENNNIPIVEDKPLAQTFYKVVEIGDFIPESLYRAVAEILAYVYRLKGRTHLYRTSDK